MTTVYEVISINNHIQAVTPVTTGILTEPLQESSLCLVCHAHLVKYKEIDFFFPVCLQSGNLCYKVHSLYHLGSLCYLKICVCVSVIRTKGAPIHTFGHTRSKLQNQIKLGSHPEAEPKLVPAFLFLNPNNKKYLFAHLKDYKRSSHLHSSCSFVFPEISGFTSCSSCRGKEKLLTELLMGQILFCCTLISHCSYQVGDSMWSQDLPNPLLAR